MSGSNPGAEIAAIGATIIMVALVGSILIIIFAIPAVLALIAMGVHALIKHRQPELEPISLDGLLSGSSDGNGLPDVNAWLMEGVVLGEDAGSSWLSA